MKTQEELNALKAEVDALNNKLRELTEEELAQVTGGIIKNPLKTKSWFFVADSNTKGYPGQVRVDVIRESNNRFPVGAAPDIRR